VSVSERCQPLAGRIGRRSRRAAHPVLAPSYTRSRQCGSRSGRVRAAPGQKIGPDMLAVSPERSTTRNATAWAQASGSRTSSSRTSGRSCSGRPARADIEARQSLPARPAVDKPSKNPADGHNIEQVCHIGLTQFVLRLPITHMAAGNNPSSALGDRVRGATGTDPSSSVELDVATGAPIDFACRASFKAGRCRLTPDAKTGSGTQAAFGAAVADINARQQVDRNLFPRSIGSPTPPLPPTSATSLRR
jgi:hypothetical protein